MKEPYKKFECYRCSYTTSKKDRMYAHLYKRKALCPIDKQDILLTDEIKEKIMRDRVYRLDSHNVIQTPVNIVNVTNNNIMNIIQTISPKLSPVDRLAKYLEYTGKESIPVCDHIENMYEGETMRLRNDVYQQGIELTCDDMLAVMDRVCKSQQSDYTDLNVIFDPTANKICLLDDTMEWCESLTEKGIKELVEKVQDGYFHEYERYTVKKILQTTGQTNQVFKEQLRDYYKFIACFDLLPLCNEKNRTLTDKFITIEIIDKFYPIYKEVKDNLKRYDKTFMKRSLLDIVRRNSEKNLRNLYVTIYELFSMDKEFRPLLG